MCGIVGYVGNEQARDILISALKRLEYRGYDSAGIAVVGKTVQLHKAVGNISKLEEALRQAGRSIYSEPGLEVYELTF